MPRSSYRDDAGTAPEQLETLMPTFADRTAARILADPFRRSQAAKPAMRRWLDRSFPRAARSRVLFVHMEDMIAWPQVYPFFHFADRFAGEGHAFRTLAWPAEGNDRLIADATAILLQSPYEPADGEIEGVLRRLRALNPAAPITYLDWFAPTDVRFADRVGDHVAYYAKKALLKDRAYYGRQPVGHTSLEEYYCAHFGLIPDDADWQVRPEIVDRLLLAPGFATAPALLNAFERRDALPTGTRSIEVHARFATAPQQLHDRGRVDVGERSHWYAVMRQHARDAVASLAGRFDCAWQGRVDSRAFMAELEQSRLCFSPFGFGELCWRDVEAALTGAVLVKPSMEHLDCFCDLYRPGETYVPVRWDLADLEDTIAGLLADPARCEAIAQQAFAAVKAYLAGPALGDFLARVTAPR